MKEYQARTKDLKVVLECYRDANEEIAKRWFRNNSQNPEYAGNVVFVLHEWESEAEADRARVSFMEASMESLFRCGPNMSGRDWMITFRIDPGAILMRQTGQTICEAIDTARNAPQPKVTVIEV